MANIITLNDKTPIFGDECFIAPTATIIGDVIIGDNCSIWFGAIIRGDVNSIHIGNNVNIQDNAVLHCTYKKTTLNIGNNVSIAHAAVVHGCTIADNVLIGIGAIVLDYAQIGKNVIIAAGAVVKEHQILEPNSVYAGIPAKKIKPLTPELAADYIKRIANNYKMYSNWYKNK